MSPAVEPAFDAALYEAIFEAIEKGTLETLDAATRAVLDVIREMGLVPAGDLMSTGDVAEYFGVGVTTASGWAARAEGNGMPEPVARLASGPVWDGGALAEWWKRWRPRKGNKAGSLPQDRVPA